MDSKQRGEEGVAEFAVRHDVVPWVGSIAEEARCFFYFAMADSHAHHRPSAWE